MQVDISVLDNMSYNRSKTMDSVLGALAHQISSLAV